MTNLRLNIENPLIEWRGPAPFYFVAIPVDNSNQIRELARELSYGWGVIPIIGKIGNTSFATSLIPKDGSYLIPIKNAVRLSENLALGQQVRVALSLDN